jgi:hypothetical protein
MSDHNVERIMLLACCTEEEARQALSKTNDVIDAVDMIMTILPSYGAPKQKTMSEEQSAFAKIREDMKSIDRSIESNIKKSDQSDSSSQELSHTHAPAPEEMTLRSDCIQSSQIPVQVEEAQKQETVCQ